MNKEIEELLEQAAGQVRDRVGDQGQLDESASRAWQRIEAQAGETGSQAAEPECARFGSLVYAYHQGTLDEANRTLLEEHLKECFTCTSRLRRLQAGRKTGEAAAPRESRTIPAWVRWGSLAAGLIIMILAAQFLFWAGMLPLVSADAVTVSSLEGSLYALEGQELLPVAAGEIYGYGETLRTGPDTRALVTLRDGSEVELDARTEFDVVGGWKGDSIRLNRGNIIVQASPQGSGRLQVLTGDCNVAVKGTIFSVRHGLKGSRVSVVEGEVWVRKGESDTVLNAGQQYTSRAGLRTRSVAEEVAWSRNSGEYLETLTMMSDLHRAIDKFTMSPDLRYTGTLARLLPRDTVIYGAAPNLVDRADVFFQALEEALNGNSQLAEAWNSEKGLEVQAGLEELKDLVYGMEGLFGEELVFAVSGTEETDFMPLVLTEAPNPSAVAAEIEAVNDRISAKTEGFRPFVIISDPAAAGTEGKAVYTWLGNGLFAVSPSLELLRQVAAAEASGGSDGFAGNPLYETVAARYDQGVDWLLAVDFPSLMRLSGEEHGEEADQAVIDTLQGIGSLLAERKLVEGTPSNQLTFSFIDEPRGFLNWLAEPMPMGAMDFVSPDATLAAGFSLRDPLQVIDEMMEYAAFDSGAQADFAEFEDATGLNVRDDIAASLGGEFLFALDGALLPSPAWKVILEVYDENLLQHAIESVVAAANAQPSDTGRDRMRITSQPVGGNTLHALEFVDSGRTFYYLFARGYLIAAPDYAVIDKALQYQSSGYSLVNSPEFIASLPAGDSVNLSGFYYHDFRTILDTVQQAVGSAGTGSTDILGYLEKSSSHFMVGVYRTDRELAIASNNNIEDCVALLGLLGTIHKQPVETAQ